MNNVLNETTVRFCGHFVTCFVYQVIHLYEYIYCFVKNLAHPQTAQIHIQRIMMLYLAGVAMAMVALKSARSESQW